MTKRQRESLNTALRCLELRKKAIAFDANLALSHKDAPPMAKKRLVEYKQIVYAMGTISEILGGKMELEP